MRLPPDCPSPIGYAAAPCRQVDRMQLDRLRRRELIALIGGAAATWPLAARAQQRAGGARIGFLGNSTPALEANLIGPFREGLRALGYEEGRTIAIEYRWAEGRYERFPAL